MFWEVVEADCSETEEELETCNTNLETAQGLLNEANEAVSSCQSQLPVSQTVHTYQDVLADCVVTSCLLFVCFGGALFSKFLFFCETPTGDWMFNTATQTDVAKTFCVWNNQFVVVENDRTYPTCVQYNSSNAADCDQDNLVCGEMTGDQQGWPNQVKGQLNVALQRADYKHHGKKFSFLSQSKKCQKALNVVFENAQPFRTTVENYLNIGGILSEITQFSQLMSPWTFVSVQTCFE